ncbi:HIT-like protein [Ramaria rubella]|nr:HIT-like protein [Ramaria rubella]KAF8579691.1 HIT-like protein [Ramaria rubella]
MTSYIIDTHIARKLSPEWKPDAPFCAFCRIIKEGAQAYKVYENESVIAILDILPLRPGHVLVIPKEHYKCVSDLPPEIAGATGQAISKVANALTKAMNNTALNVVCNQEYAQAVPHVHYHIVPAPSTASSAAPEAAPPAPLSKEEMHQREFLGRSELDDDDAETISQRIRSKL